MGLKESKFWIIAIIIIAFSTFFVWNYVVEPQIVEKEGALHEPYVKYIHTPLQKIGLVGEDFAYIGSYFWDLFWIILVIILVIITDVSFSDYGFDFSNIKKDVIFAAIFFIIFIAAAITNSYVLNKYVPEDIQNFSLFGGKSNETTQQPIQQEEQKQTLTIKLIILNFILYFIFVGPAEELFRLFILIKIGKVSGAFIAFFFSAFIFGAMHMIYGPLSQAYNAFFGGILLNTLWLLRGKKILAPIMGHGFYDFMLFLMPFIFS